MPTPRSALALLTASVLGLPLLARAQESGAAPADPVKVAPIPRDLWDQIVTEGKQESRVMDFLDHLTNRIGPRLTSSLNLQQACEWAVAELKAMGYANARLEKWGEFPVGFDRGPWSGSITSPKDMTGAIVFCTNAWTAGTKGPQEGPAILAPKSIDQAQVLREQDPNAFEGKWLLRAEGMRRGSASNFRKLEQLLEGYGALGWVYPGRETRPGKLDKDVVHRNLLMTGGSYQMRWPKLPTFPRIQVRWDQFQQMHAAVKDDKDLRLRFDVRNWFRQGPIPLYNVVAELEGLEKPEEFVVVGGHIDSWDGATGTTDNGTGTSTTLEAARILAAVGAKPRRTIRFMLWSGEEQGLMGSRAWVNQNRQDVTKNCQAALVHDGGTNYAAGIVGNATQMPVLREAFAGFDTIDEDFPFSVTEGQQPSYGSDHVAFIMARAPGFYWLQRGKAQYNYGHHTQHDTFDLAVPEYQMQTATVAALGALSLANVEARMPAPANRARRGRARRPALPSTGITINTAMEVMTAEKEGVLIAAGVRAGDKLLSLDGNKLEGGRRALRDAFREFVRSGKSKTEIRVARDGAVKTLEVTLETKAPETKKESD